MVLELGNSYAIFVYFVVPRWVSFFAEATSSTEALKFMNFQKISVNDGNGFKGGSQGNHDYASKFKSPSDGIYWFICTKFWDGKCHANLFMIGTDDYSRLQLMRIHTKFSNDDTISVSSVQNLTAGQELKIYTIYPTHTINLIGSSWGSFRLDSLMSDLVVFDVTLLKLADKSEIKYFENINIGNGWSQKTNSFVAATTGLYYFSASVGVRYHGKAHFSINKKTSVHEYCAFQVSNAAEQGVDIASRGCLLKINARDSISFVISNSESNNIIYAFGITSFRGFFYNVIHKNSLPWSLHINGDVNVKVNEKLNFDVIHEDSHRLWDAASRELFISVSGKYFLEIVGTTSDESLTGSIDMCVIVNRSGTEDKLLCLRFTSKFAGITRSRSAIVSLMEDDKLAVISLIGGRVMSGANGQAISFQGLLLYPD